MNMIRECGPKKDANGKSRQYAIFFCEYCESTVERRKDAGALALSCGCVSNVLNNMQRTGPKKLYPDIYKRWSSMRVRCTCKENVMYPRYGGRGIHICEEWSSFDVFLKWALENGYSKNLQIDRINNNGGYSPENCRWVTAKVNTRNTAIPKLNEEKVRRIKNMLASGEKQKTIAKMFGVTPPTISAISTGYTWSDI